MGEDICRIYNKDVNKYILVLSENLYLMEKEQKSTNKQIREWMHPNRKVGGNENR